MSTRQTPPPRRRPAPKQPSKATFRLRQLMAVLVLGLVLTGVVMGGSALKNYFFPAADPQPEAGEDLGPTREELSNPKDCSTEVLELEAGLAADSIPAGQAANISVLVRNTGELPCLVDMSSATINAVVTSGDDQVWASSHCGGGLPEQRRLLLDLDTSDTTVISWSGKRSAVGCPGEQPATTPGTYRLTVTVEAGDGSLSEELVFGMH